MAAIRSTSRFEINSRDSITYSSRLFTSNQRGPNLLELTWFRLVKLQVRSSNAAVNWPKMRKKFINVHF